MQRFPEYSLVQRASESGVSDTRARLSAQSNRPINAAEQQQCGSAAAKLNRCTDLQEHDPMHHLLQVKVAANSATTQATKAVLLTSNQLIIY